MSVWWALRRETQSNRESMRPLWFFHLYILSSATTAWSTLCQGRLYPHIYIYIYILLYFLLSSNNLVIYLYILSSATTAWSTLCQGRLYPHIYIYIYILLYFLLSSNNLVINTTIFCLWSLYILFIVRKINYLLLSLGSLLFTYLLLSLLSLVIW